MNSFRDADTDLKKSMTNLRITKTGYKIAAVVIIMWRKTATCNAKVNLDFIPTDY